MLNPRILVIGAGVNGCAIATGLFNGGVDVHLLARGRRFNEISSEGVVIENPFNHKRQVTRLPVTNQLNPDDIYDYVLVVVRKNQAFNLLPLLAQNGSPNIIFMGNNLLGPAEFVKVLGELRVMMGGVYAAGKRDGGVIRAMVIKSVASPIGEIDGSITPRLRFLAEILRQGGFKVELTHNIIDYQMTHGVTVAILAAQVIQHGGRVKAFAKDTEALKLYVAARREALQLVRALGHEVLPKMDITLANLPSFIQVTALRLMLNSRFGEVGLEYHISQAPDEMQQMISELKLLVGQASIDLPAIQRALGPDNYEKPLTTELTETTEK